ncbi:MAG: DUF6600 domain-containing protein, partial [Hyphomicrobiaceae bacterium]
MTMPTRTILRSAAALLLAATAWLALAAAPARAQDEDVDPQIFYEELAPYGDWVEHPRWGSVWAPRVDADWRPYTRGHWAFTEEYGWYWVAEESWGWGPFHYGRWVLDDDGTWLWIPGTEWGPAWVSWRWSDEQVGWAPLPPDAVWEGDSLVYDAAYYDAPRYAPVWVFVDPIYMTRPGMYRHYAPRSRNAFFLHRTRNVTSYGFVNRRIFNRGIDFGHYRRVVGTPVRPVRLSAVGSPRDLRGGFAGRGGVLPVYRPRIRGVAAPGAQGGPRRGLPRNLVRPPEGRQFGALPPRDARPRGVTPGTPALHDGRRFRGTPPPDGRFSGHRLPPRGPDNTTVGRRPPERFGARQPTDSRPPPAVNRNFRQPPPPSAGARPPQAAVRRPPQAYQRPPQAFQRPPQNRPVAQPQRPPAPARMARPPSPPRAAAPAAARTAPAPHPRAARPPPGQPPPP